MICCTNALLVAELWLAGLGIMLMKFSAHLHTLDVSDMILVMILVAYLTFSPSFTLWDSSIGISSYHNFPCTVSVPHKMKWSQGGG